MSSEKLPAVRVAQAAGTLFAAGAAGMSLNLSFALVPRILESPTPLMLQQWQRMYNTFKIVMPPLAIAAGVNYAYLATRFWPAVSTVNGLAAGTVARVYGIAAALCFVFVPYTLAVIGPTNRALFAKVDQLGARKLTEEVVEAGPQSESAKALVDRWGTLNLGRGVMLATAASLGLWVMI